MIDDETLNDWRLNYNLEMPAHDLAEFWRPAGGVVGQVLALKAAVEEIERLNELLAEAKTDRQIAWKANEKLLAQLARSQEALRNLLSRVANDADAHAWWCEEQEQAVKALTGEE